VGFKQGIKSMLLNLCYNAITACPSENGIIRLKAKQLEKTVVLIVSDNGYGIPKESLPQITEPFYRVDKARSREHGGEGLGMALCKQIAAAHNAEMTVESEIGEGTTVSVIFTTP
jgi:signal transduction histidine kinase